MIWSKNAAPEQTVTPALMGGLRPGYPGDDAGRSRRYREGMGTLSDLSHDIADLVGRLGPSVVRGDGRRGRPASGIIWADNLVLPADHVLEQEDAIQVTGSTTTVKASIAGRDPGT